MPAALKNRRMVVKTKAGRTMVIGSPEARADAKRIAELAAEACGPFFEDDELEVFIDWVVAEGVVRVEINALGPRPKGVTGRRRDVQNIPGVILDALEGIAYRNDNQVRAMTVRRVV